MNRIARREAATLRIVDPPAVTVAHAGACGRVERLAGREDRGRKGFLAWLLRRGVPRRDSRSRSSKREGRIQAFATLWPSAQKSEVSLDLMRFRPSAPKGVMDGLLAWLLHWAKQEGYPVVQPGHGAAVGPRSVRRIAAVGRKSAASSTGTASRSTTSRACAPTSRSSIRCGNRAISPIQADSRCREYSPTSRRSSRAGTAKFLSGNR